MSNAGANILHADLDAFYASVEQLLDPSLRGRPIAVGGGVVLAASYEARVFGVHGGMSGYQARKLCPSLLFVAGHFSEYQRLADRVIDVLVDFTPAVERISIDEAFCDVSGAARLFGSPAAIAASIRSRVRTEIGLPISVGIARTKHLAKIASQVAKPDGLVLVEPEYETEFLAPLPVGLIWGVGPVTRGRLADEGIRTIGELAEADPSALQRLLGPAVGSKLGALANNVDQRRVESGRRAKSVGAQSAFGRCAPDPQFIMQVVSHLADRVGGRLRAKHLAGRTITVRVRCTGLRSVTRSITLAAPLSATRTLAEVAADLVASAVGSNGPRIEVTLIGIAVSQLVNERALQLELSLGAHDERSRQGTSAGAGRWSVDHSVDAVRRRFGRDAVGYASVVFSGAGRVPDEFRALAEHDD